MKLLIEIPSTCRIILPIDAMPMLLQATLVKEPSYSDNEKFTVTNKKRIAIELVDESQIVIAKPDTEE